MTKQLSSLNLIYQRKICDFYKQALCKTKTRATEKMSSLWDIRNHNRQKFRLEISNTLSYERKHKLNVITAKSLLKNVYEEVQVYQNGCLFFTIKFLNKALQQCTGTLLWHPFRFFDLIMSITQKQPLEEFCKKLCS